MLSKSDPTLFEMCNELTTKQVHIDKPFLFVTLRMVAILVREEGEKSGTFDAEGVIEALDSLVEVMAFVTIAHEQTEYIQGHIKMMEECNDN